MSTDDQKPNAPRLGGAEPTPPKKGRGPQRPERAGRLVLPPPPPPEPEEEEPEGPTRTEKKRAGREASDGAVTLIENLLALPLERQQALPLSDFLQDGLTQLRKMKPDGARRRLLKRLAHEVRGDVGDELRAAILPDQTAVVAEKERHHEAERWRERLIDEGDPGLDELFTRFPTADKQRLRQLLRQARAGTANAARLLYRAVFALLDAP